MTLLILTPESVCLVKMFEGRELFFHESNKRETNELMFLPVTQVFSISSLVQNLHSSQIQLGLDKVRSFLGISPHLYK